MSPYRELVEQGHGEERLLITLELTPDHAILVLCDPARLNALSTGLVVQLRARLAGVRRTLGSGPS